MLQYCTFEVCSRQVGFGEDHVPEQCLGEIDLRKCDAFGIKKLYGLLLPDVPALSPGRGGDNLPIARNGVLFAIFDGLPKQEHRDSDTDERKAG